jgi:prepilin-type processing-associated H-X9-DG protein
MGTLMYAQDYDEVLPPMENYGRFQAVTFPYARSSKAFVCPATGLPYTLNVSLSQKNVITITDPAHTLLLRDTAPHQDGATTYGYLDGHVKRK